MKRKWYYLKNPFVRTGLRNYKLLLSLATNHVDALTANQNVPEISQLLTRTKPLLDSFNSEMQAKLSSKSVSKGYVYNFKDLLEQMPAKLARWDIEIQNIYPKNTLEYRTIFGSKRSEVYKGTSEQKLNKLLSLQQKVESTSGLDNIAIDIKSFAVLLNDSRSIKGQKLEIYDQKQDALAIEYDKLSIMLYRNLGRLIDKYANNTDEIERYFNLYLIRTKNNNHNIDQQGYTLTIPPNSTKIADISFSPDDTLNISNISNTTIYYYSAISIDSAKPSTLQQILPNDETEVTAILLGAPTNKFLIFVNQSTTETAEVEIILF